MRMRRKLPDEEEVAWFNQMKTKRGVFDKRPKIIPGDESNYGLRVFPLDTANPVYLSVHNFVILLLQLNCTMQPLHHRNIVTVIAL